MCSRFFLVLGGFLSHEIAKNLTFIFIVCPVLVSLSIVSSSSILLIVFSSR